MFVRMKPEKTSAALALAAQAGFGTALAFASWKTAALIALFASITALVVRFIPQKAPPREAAAFPRLELGSFLVFASMCASSLFMEGDALFPLTGLFFASGLACACWAETGFRLKAGKSAKALLTASAFIGCAYAVSAIVQLACFPRPAYLYWGVGLLVAASLADLGRGLAASLRSRAPGGRPAEDEAY
jgi:hypothetical protein